MRNSTYFTTVDLAHGYHQVKVADDSIPKTAFITPDGHYEYLRMPFGLANAPAVFQRAINSILGQMRFKTAFAYLDDILIPSQTFTKGLESLREVLSLFRNAGMTFRLTKCHFFYDKLEYLGHELSCRGVQPGQAKIQTVSEYPKPRNVHQIRQFIGLTSYFRRFIKGFATIAKPLTNLTKKDVPFSWTEQQEDAFQTLKRKLVERPVLALYNREAITELHTDASKHGLGGVLLQRQHDGSLRPICYYSRPDYPDQRKLPLVRVGNLSGS